MVLPVLLRNNQFITLFPCLAYQYVYGCVLDSCLSSEENVCILNAYRYGIKCPHRKANSMTHLSIILRIYETPSSLIDTNTQTMHYCQAPSVLLREHSTSNYNIFNPASVPCEWVDFTWIDLPSAKLLLQLTNSGLLKTENIFRTKVFNGNINSI